MPWYILAMQTCARCNSLVMQYEKYAYLFIDVNECLNNNGGCAQTCINDVGSFHCTCSPGYTLNGLSCLGNHMIIMLFFESTIQVLSISFSDINECSANTHNCQQRCTNTPGGFTCGCQDGYRLQSDRKSCSGMLA